MTFYENTGPTYEKRWIRLEKNVGYNSA